MVDGKLEGVFLYFFLNEIFNGYPYHLHIEVPLKAKGNPFLQRSVCKAC